MTYKNSLLFVLMTLVCQAVSAQLFAGASFGIFNIPGANYGRFKGLGPTVKIEYALSDGSTAYFDASLYNKEQPSDETLITEESGAAIGYAETQVKYSIKHLQAGFKGFIGKDVTEKGFSFFLGGGFAVSLVKSVYSYDLPGYNVSDSKYNSSSYGFHFTSGFQYNFDPVILELKGNFDLVLKPLVSGSSYILTSSRLGVMIPLTKYR